MIAESLGDGQKMTETLKLRKKKKTRRTSLHHWPLSHVRQWFEMAKKPGISELLAGSSVPLIQRKGAFTSVPCGSNNVIIYENLILCDWVSVLFLSPKPG